MRSKSNREHDERCARVKYKYSITELERAEQNKWLTDRQRQVFDMFYRHGWRIEDIAANLGVNRSTVSRDLRKIRDVTRAVE